MRAEHTATLDENALLDTVTRLVANQQWAEADETLLGIDLAHAAIPLRLRGNMARNFAALHRHRPRLLETLTATPNQGRFQPVALGDGILTLAAHSPSSGITPVGSAKNPAGEARHTASQILAQCPPASAPVLTSISDGHLVDQLTQASATPTKTGATQPVVIIEPDPELLLHVLLIHDFSSDDGPIAQQRITWYVGNQWSRELRDDYTDNPWIAAPDVIVRQGPHNEQIAGAVKSVQSEIAARNQNWKQIARRTDESRSTDELIAILQDNESTRPRRPRVLLPATRFSTVLHESYRDAAGAFETLGFDVLLLSEPHEHHRLNPGVIHRALAEFNPDLVLIIDHLRHEYGDTFPPNLPVATWTQDHLPNLTNRSAGQSVGDNDFILTTVKPWYVSEFDYPARQCLPLPKLTRDRATRTSSNHTTPRRPEHDLVYVSNASGHPDTILRGTIDFLRRESNISRNAADIAESCGRQLIASYNNQQPQPYLWHLGRILDEIAEDAGHPWNDPNERSTILQALNHPLNNTLFRQQALRWAGNIARARSLDFALYGMHWEKNDEFAEFAKGTVTYGDGLDELTRAARINLQIVPSFCLHQRMLDGIAAGGFYLVRPAPADLGMPRFAQFLAEHCPDDTDSIDAVRAALEGENLDRFDQLLIDTECLSELTGPIDIVAWVRDCMEGEILDHSGSPIPHFNDITFTSETELESRLDRYLPDETTRRTITESQWNAVEQRLTYRAGLRRIISVMHRRLTEQLTGVGGTT